MTTADAVRVSHCRECRMSFGLVERSPEYPANCTACVESLSPRIACMECGRLITNTEWCYEDGWIVLCVKCGRKKILRDLGDIEIEMTGYDQGDDEWHDLNMREALLLDLLHAIDKGSHERMASIWYDLNPYGGRMRV